MRSAILGAAAISLAACASPEVTPAVTTGATTGAVGGAMVGGPVGAAVGAVGGAIVGGLADENVPRFRAYVVEQRVPSYAYQGEVAVGTVLPETGVTYYDAPPEYNLRTYRYTVVNNHVVLVDPATRRVVQIID